MNSEMSMGTKLRNARKEAGLLQKDMAEKLGVTISTISDYEKERVRISGNALHAWATVCGKTVDELIGVVHAPAIPYAAARAALPEIIRNTVEVMDGLSAEEQEYALSHLKSIVRFLKQKSDRSGQDHPEAE
jgi:transcriptional regulator with XRE-family HTH domain